MTRTEFQLKQAAKSKWKLWRLVFSDGGFDYSTVFHRMTMDEVDEANAALDIYSDKLKKAMKKKK